ncbi:MAG: alpha/beta fold hydrolase, partial [Sphingobacteriaceae bacterium]|nr:alpha/beta fold hydrolase [Cytophagaceae bacterium]
MKTPDWVDTTAYPFAFHTLEHPDGRLHYLDEGRGPTLLFCHGTPEWSFGYRHLITRLSAHYRCVAVDMLGFGLSEKPVSADYTVVAHALRLEWAVQTLNLKNITLIASDFGGGIALAYALRHPENVRRIALWNTWMWALNDDPHFARPARLMQTGLGRFLYKSLNFSINVLMPQAYGNRRLLTPAVQRQYRMPFQHWSDRAAPHELAREILNAGIWWDARWAELDALREKPFLLLWGLTDRLVPPTALRRWRERLPEAGVVEYPEAGHFPHEECPEPLAAVLEKFL